MRGRIYDPLAGRFMTPDPVLSEGLNRYSYVGNNPVNATDPSGFAKTWEWVGFTAYTVAVAGMLTYGIVQHYSLGSVASSSAASGAASAGLGAAGTSAAMSVGISAASTAATNLVSSAAGKAGSSAGSKATGSNRSNYFAKDGPYREKMIWDAGDCHPETCRVVVPVLPSFGDLARAGAAAWSWITGVFGGKSAAAGTISAANLLKPAGGVQALATVTQWTKGGVGLAGLQANLARTGELINQLPGRIDAIRAGGVTKEMAQQWAQFYRQIAAQNPVTATAGNPNALPRAKLMQAIADLL